MPKRYIIFILNILLTISVVNNGCDDNPVNTETPSLTIQPLSTGSVIMDKNEETKVFYGLNAGYAGWQTIQNGKMVFKETLAYYKIAE